MAVVLTTLSLALSKHVLAQANPTDREIDLACEKAFPNFFTDFFDRRQCIAEAKEKRTAAERERKERAPLSMPSMAPVFPIPQDFATTGDR